MISDLTLLTSIAFAVVLFVLVFNVGAYLGRRKEVWRSKVGIRLAG